MSSQKQIQISPPDTADSYQLVDLDIYDIQNKLFHNFTLLRDEGMNSFAKISMSEAPSFAEDVKGYPQIGFKTALTRGSGFILRLFCLP